MRENVFILKIVLRRKFDTYRRVVRAADVAGGEAVFGVWATVLGGRTGTWGDDEEKEALCDDNEEGCSLRMREEGM